MIVRVIAPEAVQLESPVVQLGRMMPVVNGISFPDTRPAVAEAPDGLIIVRFSLPVGTFSITLQPDRDSRCWLRYGLEGLPDDFHLLSFGLRLEPLGNLRAFLRNGYFSWDGSYYVPAEELQFSSDAQGYAMTQLLPLFGTGSLVIGFDRHDRYQQPFTLKREDGGFSLTMETLWDNKDCAELSHCESERLVIFEHDGVEDALRDWARLVAAVMSPRLSAPPITGWCSWYNLYAAITEANMLEHLRGVREVVERDKLPMWVFQIDDGFTPEMGDWLEVKPQFPRGMKPLLDDIRAAGFTPGLWIAPFTVGNRSHLYREHPDWVVQDRAVGGPLAHMRFYGEFRWHKRSEEYYILDTTHPDAFDYLRQVFRTWRQEWGCEYFKTDFMHFGSEYGPDRAVWHQPGWSRIEIWRRTAEMIREEIGDALWLGCGCPLWASVGLVDAVRIGGDVGVSWEGERQTAQSLLRDQATRNFANHLLWQADPDCILLRERFHHLSPTEIESLAIYAGMSGGLVTTSDDISQLSPERLRLWKLLLSPHKSRCRFPLLGQSPLVMQDTKTARHGIRALDPVLVQVRSALNQALPAAVFILNTGETPVQRRYPLHTLDLPDRLYARRWWPDDKGLLETVDALTVSLLPHQGQLWFVTDNPDDELPVHLP
ncbi:MAG: alpha-galactosidase [Chloroflexi bacterium]|nr:alpha-galactosidase [Chloroflexota bacterium]